MKKKDHSIIEGARQSLDFLRGKANGSRVVTFRVEAGTVREIRRSLRLSQTQFADQFGFSPATVRNWEQGRTTPDTPARILLAVIRRDPDVARAAAEDVRS
ncbi:MAG: helix-turn-helix domain-containing protein [Bryobacteraceae bacterium]|nr:helix-turn-helix domain-containing protein [Bryobacteraceae bacterium]